MVSVSKCLIQELVSMFSFEFVFFFSSLLIYFAGAGCFKCGSLDHIAKDCTGDPTAKPHSKYMLKDDSTQRGGDGFTR